MWLKRFAKKNYRYFVPIIFFAAVVGVSFYITEVPQVQAQSAVHLLNPVTLPAAGQKVLVITPHPDDETIAAGGFIVQSIKNGADVRIVLVTNANRQNQQDIRYAEFKKATSTLGVTEGNLVFLGFPDSKLKSENPSVLYASLKDQIEQFNPDIIIYPHPKDYNPDHATIGKVINSIIKTESLNMTTYEYIVHYKLIYPRPRKFAGELHLLPPKELFTYDRAWLSLTLPQDVENCKQEAIFKYESQLHNPELHGLLLSFIRQNEAFAVPR